jgi:hypothetical protein
MHAICVNLDLARFENSELVRLCHSNFLVPLDPGGFDLIGHPIRDEVEPTIAIEQDCQSLWPHGGVCGGNGGDVE